MLEAHPYEVRDLQESAHSDLCLFHDTVMCSVRGEHPGGNTQRMPCGVEHRHSNAVGASPNTFDFEFESMQRVEGVLYADGRIRGIVSEVAMRSIFGCTERSRPRAAASSAGSRTRPPGVLPHEAISSRLASLHSNLPCCPSGNLQSQPPSTRTIRKATRKASSSATESATGRSSSPRCTSRILRSAKPAVSPWKSSPPSTLPPRTTSSSECSGI